MIDQHDQKLVARLKTGDDRAFEKLFKKYNQKLCNFCMKMLRSKTDAEGIVQNTFMKIWETRHLLNENLPFSSYVYKIARNKVLNEMRKQINQRYYIEYLLEYTEMLEDTTEKNILFSELEKTIHHLISLLPDRRREIFLLSRDEGLTYKEIADKLDISENTVDTQIRKVLDFFRQSLREKVLPLVR
jgi:RNA polymerase sigma-70 factor (ECF subfamily)